MTQIQSTLRRAALGCTLLLLGAGYGIASSAADSGVHATPPGARTGPAKHFSFAVTPEAGTLQIAQRSPPDELGAGAGDHLPQ